jgi:5-methylcytosine-specific restriction endonuclease McrA
MSQEKKRIRAAFNAACLRRDGNKCRLCGARDGLDVHHITDRHLMPNGGYVASNGITVCQACHMDVEDVANHVHDNEGYMPLERWQACKAENLYRLIGSSHEQAVADSERL